MCGIHQEEQSWHMPIQACISGIAGLSMHDMMMLGMLRLFDLSRKWNSNDLAKL